MLLRVAKFVDGQKLGFCSATVESPTMLVKRIMCQAVLGAAAVKAWAGPNLNPV